MITPITNKNNIKLRLAICLLFFNGFSLTVIGETENTNPKAPLSFKNTQQQIISSLKEDTCISNRYTVDELQKDIFLLMKQNQFFRPYTLKKFWRNISLEELPIGHVNYFLTADQALSTDIDVSHCQSAPCVFNTIYNKPKDDIAGFTAFLFFLQTGYILSGVAKIPRMVTPENIPLSAFYFKDDELYWLWLWMKSTPHQFFRLKSFQYIYRFPHNMIIDSDPYICGTSEALLYTKDTQGFIVLPDCAFKEMSLPFSPTDLSYLFTLFHEIGHHYDFSLSFQHPLSKRHSETEDFLKLSNWKKEKSYKDNASIEQRNYQPDTEQHDGFFRDYSQESPSEDFADSLAAYRIYPDILSTTSPMKFQYLKERVFNGRDYTQQGNKKYYTSKISDLIRSQAQNWMSICSNAKNFSKEDSLIFTFSQNTQEEFLKKGLLVNDINCLEMKINQEIKKLEVQLKYDEFEACSFFKNNESNWWYEIIDSHSDFLLSFLNNIETKPIHRTEVAKFRDQINRDFPAEETAVHCHQRSPSPQRCFRDHLKKYVKDISKKHFHFSEDFIFNELNRFYSIHSYNETIKNAVDSARTTLQITPSSIKNKADELVNYCSTQNQQDNNIKLVQPYKGPDDFFILETWFINCININFKNFLRTLLSDTKGKINNSTPVFIEFIDQIYHNDLLLEVSKSVYGVISRQYNDIKKEHNLIKTKIFQYFDHHPDWYKEYPNDKNIFDICLKHSQKIISSFNKNNTLVVDLLPEVSNAVCTRLAFRTPRDRLFHNSFFEIFWNLFEKEWISASKDCVPRKNIDSLPLSELIEELLFQWECAFSKITPSANKAWEQLNENPEFQKYKHKKQEAFELLIQRAKDSLREFILKHLS